MNHYDIQPTVKSIVVAGSLERIQLPVNLLEYKNLPTLIYTINYKAIAYVNALLLKPPHNIVWFSDLAKCGDGGESGGGSTAGRMRQRYDDICAAFPDLGDSIGVLVEFQRERGRFCHKATINLVYSAYHVCKQFLIADLNMVGWGRIRHYFREEVTRELMEAVWSPRRFWAWGFEVMDPD